MADKDEAAKPKPARATTKKATPAKKATAATKKTAEKVATVKAAPAVKATTKKTTAAATKKTVPANKIATKAVAEKPVTKKTAARKTTAKKAEAPVVEPVVETVAEITPTIDLTTAIDISDTAEQLADENVIDIKTLAETERETEGASIAATNSATASTEVASSPVDEIAKPPRAPRKTAAPKPAKATPAKTTAKTTAKKTTAKKATAKKAEPTPIEVAPAEVAPVEVAPIQAVAVEPETPVKPKRQPRKKAAPKKPAVVEESIVVEPPAAAPIIIEPVIDEPIVEIVDPDILQAPMPGVDIETETASVEISLDVEDEEEASDRLAEATLEVAPEPIVQPEPAKPIDVIEAPVLETPVPETTYQPINKPAPQTVHLPAVVYEPIETARSFRRSTATLVTIILTAIVFLGVGLVLGSRSGTSGQATYTPTTLNPNAVTTAPVDPSSSTTVAGSTSGNAVTRLSGSDSRQSGLFSLGKGPVQIRYNSTGGNLTVRLLPASGVDSGDDFLCTSACDREADLVKSSGGQFYLDVQATGGGNWNVSVTD